jgi:S-formylglutathione hydrolase
MGGAGALTVALKNAKDYCSVSAFSPIANPVESGFCKDAMSKYFGSDLQAANQYSPVALIEQKVKEGIPASDIIPPALVYTGTSDPWEKFLES